MLMRLPIFAGLVLLALFAGRSADAAPQILAVAANEDGQKLFCEGGTCRVELSAFCLQKARRFPSPATVYQPHDAAMMTLVFLKGGQEIARLPAAQVAAIRSKRSFTAVDVRFDAELMAEMGATNAYLEVQPNATLVPEAVPGDWNPQSSNEIAQAVGPLRLAAGQWLEGAGEQRVASRLINRVLNRLPRDGAFDATETARLWNDVSATSGDTATQGFQRARDIVRNCIAETRRDERASPVGCLERGHDRLQYRMNQRFWKSLEYGS